LKEQSTALQWKLFLGFPFLINAVIERTLSRQLKYVSFLSAFAVVEQTNNSVKRATRREMQGVQLRGKGKVVVV